MQPAAEIDAVCLIDGKLWIGEVKTNTAEFKPREMRKLIREAQKLRADRAFVFAPEGDQNALQRRCEESVAATGFTGVHLHPPLGV